MNQRIPTPTYVSQDYFICLVEEEYKSIILKKIDEAFFINLYNVSNFIFIIFTLLKLNI